MLPGHTITVVNHELGVDHAPIYAAPRPFIRNIHHRQIQHFQKAVVRREYGFRFGHLPELAIEAFDGIRGTVSHRGSIPNGANELFIYFIVNSNYQNKYKIAGNVICINVAYS